MNKQLNVFIIIMIFTIITIIVFIFIVKVKEYVCVNPKKYIHLIS